MMSVNFHSVRALAVLLAGLTGAPAGAAPIVVDLPRIERSLARSKLARVVFRQHTITVDHPVVDSAGLAFRRAIDYPPGRPALIVTGPWDTIPPPLNPMPWTAIEGLEASHRTRTPTAVFGGLIGAGIGMTGAVFVHGMDEGHTENLEMEMLAFAAGSTAVGVLLGGART
jgi:hypothetical protein